VKILCCEFTIDEVVELMLRRFLSYTVKLVVELGINLSEFSSNLNRLGAEVENVMGETLFYGVGCLSPESRRRKLRLIGVNFCPAE
jgi:hypothetical protein